MISFFTVSQGRSKASSSLGGFNAGSVPRLGGGCEQIESLSEGLHLGEEYDNRSLSLGRRDRQRHQLYVAEFRDETAREDEADNDTLPGGPAIAVLRSVR